ncbi:competence type IV pilus minor pilin ComGG [Evansella halocellulosilytica]|uniref:competence type IV pilus minor pilin ComGG n=1 Tax=Evansella halocellulosilytica TaxID=2011013 RepID=UPI0015CAEBE8|nr:competence type IV pilus minor pilin ComGG [Evansella halocellulosilytica]
MKENEKGFVLFLSLLLMFLLTGTLLHLLTIYENEKSFIYLEKERNTVDNLLLTTTIHITELMNEENKEHFVSGEMLYDGGVVTYTLLPEDTLYFISLEAQTHNGTTRVVDISYDYEHNEILDWRERPR